MANENGRLGTPVFYKFIVGIFSMLLVAGVIGVWNTSNRLTRIEVKLEHIEKIMADRFTGTQGKSLAMEVTHNADDLKILANKLNDHLLWAATQEKWLSQTK